MTTRDLAKWIAPAGLIAAGLMLCGVFLRYPNGDIPANIGSWTASSLSLLIFGAWAFLTWRSRQADSAGGSGERLTGTLAGLICGGLWMLEIAFNNFVDPSISTATARLYADDGTWALVAVLILLASFRQARLHGFRSGLRAGAGSGFVSGLVSCLTALALVLFFMPFLLRDPLNIEEYRAQTNLPDMATYFAYETAAGALIHLVALGCIIGILLGAVGSSLGALAPAQRVQPSTPPPVRPRERG